jgi:hypothetical protein
MIGKAIGFFEKLSLDETALLHLSLPEPLHLRRAGQQFIQPALILDPAIF